MILSTFVFFVLGLVVLVVGAEVMVRGASRLAAAFGIAPLVIGLTVVAFGTSAPELAVSLQSAFNGQADLALGNVIGSNIANILLILGVAALTAPLVVASQLVRLDVPLMIGASVIVYLMGLDGRLNRWDGLILFLGVVAYTTWLVRQSRREGKDVQDEYEGAYEEGSESSWYTSLLNLALVAGGLFMLVVGARWLVESAVTMARWWGLSELIIGLTVVAVGTSLPEIATSIVAVLRGERDIAVGNAIGSNIFNLLSVLGLTSLFAPSGIPVPAAVMAFDLPVVIAIAIACLPIFYTGNLVARWEGALFLGYYVAYLVYLIFDATGHDTLPLFSSVMGLFVAPLTLLGLSFSVWREARSRRVASMAKL
ncbi:MAG TPA: calcium/sodium antiporter [Caldilineaceae bacterium]|nr:calcium/sodium antiporter [Caldilineaceae bacterium]